MRGLGNSKWGTLYTSIFIQFYTVWWPIIDPWRFYFITQVSPNIRDITVLLVHLLEKGCCMKPCGTFFLFVFSVIFVTVTAPTKPNISKPLHLSTQSFYWKHFDLPSVFGDFSLNGAVLYWTWFKSFCLTSYVCDACRRRRADVVEIFPELNEGVSSP